MARILLPFRCVDEPLSVCGEDGAGLLRGKRIFESSDIDVGSPARQNQIYEHSPALEEVNYAVHFTAENRIPCLTLNRDPEAPLKQ